MQISLTIRDKKIKLNEAIARYNFLFGNTYTPENID